MAKISQREARRLKRLVERLQDELRRQRYTWAEEFPGGTKIAQLVCQSQFVMGSISAARELHHAVVCTVDESGLLRFYALPLPEVK